MHERGQTLEVVTPSISGAAGQNGFPVAYVVNPNGPRTSSKSSRAASPTPARSRRPTAISASPSSVIRARKEAGSMRMKPCKRTGRGWAQSVSIAALALAGAGGGVAAVPAAATAGTYKAYMCRHGYGTAAFRTAGLRTPARRSTPLPTAPSRAARSARATVCRSGAQVGARLGSRRVLAARARRDVDHRLDVQRDVQLVRGLGRALGDVGGRRRGPCRRLWHDTGLLEPALLAIIRTPSPTPA